MMLTPLVCAQLCQDLYGGVVQWDNVWTRDGVIVAHSQVNGVDRIILRGSVTFEDWVRDAEAWPDWDTDLGYCHNGFLQDMNEVYAEVSKVVTGPVEIMGHSLGAARALILAGKFVAAKKDAACVTVFGSPRPGFSHLAHILQASNTSIRSYKNREDPVTLVPYLAGLYVHPATAVMFDEAPQEGDITGIRDHAIALYVRGAAKV